MGTHRLRALNVPVPVRVREGADGRPGAVALGGRRAQPVVEVQEEWRVDEGWWRGEPLSRLYARVVLGDGRQVTLYHDLVEGGWWAQRQ